MTRKPGNAGVCNLDPDNVWLPAAARGNARRGSRARWSPAFRRVAIGTLIAGWLVYAGLADATGRPGNSLPSSGEPLISIAAFAVMALAGWCAYSMVSDVWSAGRWLTGSARWSQRPHQGMPASIRRTVHSPRTEHE